MQALTVTNGLVGLSLYQIHILCQNFFLKLVALQKSRVYPAFIWGWVGSSIPVTLNRKKQI